MVEGGSGILQMLRQRYPQLETVQTLWRIPQIFRGSFGVYHAFTRRHPVYGSGLYFNCRTQAVAVENRTFQQVGKRKKPDVRVRQYIKVLVVS